MLAQESTTPIVRLGSARAWMIWGTAMLFCLFQFILQLSSGVIVKQLMTDFHLTAFGSGLLVSAYYYIYVALQIPAGVLMDRYKPQTLLTGSAALCGISTILFSMSSNVTVAFISRLLMGTGGACAFIGSIHLMRQWFQPKYFAILIGATEAFGMLATVFGTVSVAWLIAHTGWRHGMLMMGCFALLCSALSGILVRENPDYTASRQPAISFKDRLRLVVQDIGLLYNGLYCGIMFSVITVFTALWGIPFLRKLTDMSLTQAGVMQGGDVSK